MGIYPTAKTIVKKSEACADSLIIESRLHKESGLYWREDDGEQLTGEEFECSGLDENVYLEDGEILEVEPCDAQDAEDNFSGQYRVRGLNGDIQKAYERAPRRWCVESNSASSGGAGPVRSSGDVILVEGLSLKIKSQCTPLNIQFWADICGWNYYPSTPEDVQDYLEYTVFQTTGEEEREEIETQRCSSGGADKRLGSCFDLPANSEIEIVLDAGYQYLNKVDETFSSTLSGLRILADVYEQTSRKSLRMGDC